MDCLLEGLSYPKKHCLVGDILGMWHLFGTLGSAYMTPISTCVSFEQDIWSPAEKKKKNPENILMRVCRIAPQHDYTLYDTPMGKSDCL